MARWIDAAADCLGAVFTLRMHLAHLREMQRVTQGIDHLIGQGEQVLF